VSDVADLRTIIDTQFIIWAILNEAGGKADEESLRRQARACLDELERQNRKLVVPTPVLAEVLVPNHRIERHALRKLKERCRILPFDSNAALHFRDVFLAAKNTSEGNCCEQDDRVKIKFDAMIVAIALAARIRSIVTFDRQLRRLAEMFGIRQLQANDVLPFRESGG